MRAEYRGQTWPFSIDGIELEFQDFGPGEVSEESVVLVTALRAGFVGDLVYNHIHPWLAEGRSHLWAAQLEKLANTLPGNWTVYLGHGAAGTTDVITAQHQFIEDMQRRITSNFTLSGLNIPAKGRIEAELVRRYPDWPLASLVPANVASVAKELSKKSAQSGNS